VCEGEEKKEPPHVRFSKEAQKIFDDWLVAHMNALKSLDFDDPIAGHMGKARGLLVRLCLVLHLASWAGGETDDPKTVEPLSLTRAATLLGEYLIPMWKRIFAAFGSTAADVGAHRIAKWIKDGSVTKFGVREVRRKHWSGLLEDKEIQSALDMLVAHSWIRPEQVSTGGRPPSQPFVVNPRVHSSGGLS
jgi:hypothetical protein